MVRYRGADGKWRRAPAARGGNGRIIPGGIVLHGRNTLAPASYTYELRLYENRQAKYLPAGENAADAEAARLRLQRQRVARTQAEDAGLKVEPDASARATLAASAFAYIQDAEMRGASEAAAQARLVTDEFQRMTGRVWLDEVRREDVLKFHTALRARGCSPRTVANKHARLASWLRFAGLPTALLPPKPRHDEQLPTIYTREQVAAILAAADNKTMRLAIGLALKCGLREQEIVHLEWSDISRAEKMLRVRSKPRLGFRVKDAEERDLPIPADLLAELEQAAGEKERGLVVSTRSGKANHKLLRTLKRLAKAAGLNCGHCDGCAGLLQECQEWTLHKFRRTYCTLLLRNRFDVRTVQALMGHADMASTMRYLRPAATEEIQAQLNSVKWD
jgi:integrase